MNKQKIVGSGMVFATILALFLIVAGVTQHPASAQGSGVSLLWADVALLLVYGFAGTLVWRQRSSGSITAVMVGARIGLLVGAVGIGNHLIEAFVPARPFVLVICPVLLTLALFGAAGAAAWERTESLLLAVVGGVCCAVVATLITLCFAISFNLLFAARVDWQLRETFAANGMIDRAAFRVRNILEASWEILVRMPLLAVCLDFAGAAIHAWMSRQSRRAVLLAAIFLAPIAFATGAAALWHANATERVARPPFVLSGVLLTGVSLCAAYPIWSVFDRSTAKSRSAGNS